MRREQRGRLAVSTRDELMGGRCMYHRIVIFIFYFFPLVCSCKGNGAKGIESSRSATRFPFPLLVSVERAAVFPSTSHRHRLSLTPPSTRRKAFIGIALLPLLFSFLSPIPRRERDCSNFALLLLQHLQPVGTSASLPQRRNEKATCIVIFFLITQFISSKRNFFF